MASTPARARPRTFAEAFGVSDDVVMACAAASPAPAGPATVSPTSTQTEEGSFSEMDSNGIENLLDMKLPAHREYQYELMVATPLRDIRDDTRNSKSKKEGSALFHLNVFLKDHFQQRNTDIYGRDYLRAEDLEYVPQRDNETQWWDDMIGRFFFYLGAMAMVRNSPSRGKLAYESASGYSSAVKSYLENKFRTQTSQIPVFQAGKWRMLRTRLLASFQEHHNMKGTKMSNPHIASTEEDREAMALGCIWTNDPLSAEFFHLNNSMMHCVGRGSEVALTRVENITTERVNELSCSYNCLGVRLRKQKQGTEQDLNVYPHRDSLHQDYYFSLLYLIVMNAGAFCVGLPFLFPAFAAKASNLSSGEQKKSDSKVSEYWTTVFKALQGQLETVGFAVNNLSSHHGKKGANQLMAEVPGVSGLAQIFRAGWAVRGLHSLFDYVIDSRRMTNAAGKALSNWTCKIGECVAGGQPPSVDDISTHPEQMQAFVDQLFWHDCDNMFPEGVRLLLVGSLLRHYDGFCDLLKSHPLGTFGDPCDHLFVSTVAGCLQKAGVSKETFCAWKKEVKEGFFNRNAIALPIENFPRELLESSFCTGKLLMDPRCFVDHFNTLAQSVMSLNNQYFQVLQTLKDVRQNSDRQFENLEKLVRSQGLGVVSRRGEDGEEVDGALVPEEEAYVNKYTVSSRRWRKNGNVRDYFFHFFDSRAMQGYQKDLDDPGWSKKPDKEGVKARFGRLKRTVKLMLMYCDGFPEERPVDPLLYAQWCRAVETMAEGAEAIIRMDVMELDSTKILTQGILIQSKAVRKSELEKSLPEDTPELYINFFN